MITPAVDYAPRLSWYPGAVRSWYTIESSRGSVCVLAFSALNAITDFWRAEWSDYVGVRSGVYAINGAEVLSFSCYVPGVNPTTGNGIAVHVWARVFSAPIGLVSCPTLRAI